MYAAGTGRAPHSAVLGSVDDEVGAVACVVANEELLFLGHPVLPELLSAGESAVASEAACQPYRCRRIDPDGVGETADRLAASAGNAFENDGGHPGLGLPLTEGISVPVRPVPGLVVGILAAKQRLEYLSVEAWPPSSEVIPRDKVVDLDDRGFQHRGEAASEVALSGSA